MVIARIQPIAEHYWSMQVAVQPMVMQWLSLDTNTFQIFSHRHVWGTQEWDPVCCRPLHLAGSSKHETSHCFFNGLQVKDQQRSDEIHGIMALVYTHVSWSRTILSPWYKPKYIKNSQTMSHWMIPNKSNIDHPTSWENTHTHTHQSRWRNSKREARHGSQPSWRCRPQTCEKPCIQS